MSFSSFTKTREPLPFKYQDIYDAYYKINRKGESKYISVAQWLERWLHRQVARSSQKYLKTLEIGAGTLNQLHYEKTQCYDIVEPFETQYKDSPLLLRVNRIYSDVSEVEVPRGGYDRVTSIATFEHILNLPEVVATVCDLLSPGGKLYVGIPNEGRFLWKLAYTLSTGREFRRLYGVDYSVLMNFEHCNTADEVEVILKFFFDEVRMKLFGISKTFALYRYYECESPKYRGDEDLKNQTE